MGWALYSYRNLRCTTNGNKTTVPWLSWQQYLTSITNLCHVKTLYASKTLSNDNLKYQQTSSVQEKDLGTAINRVRNINLELNHSIADRCTVRQG